MNKTKDLQLFEQAIKSLEWRIQNELASEKPDRQYLEALIKALEQQKKFAQEEREKFYK